MRVRVFGLRRSPTRSPRDAPVDGRGGGQPARFDDLPAAGAAVHVRMAVAADGAAALERLDGLHHGVAAVDTRPLDGGRGRCRAPERSRATQRHSSGRGTAGRGLRTPGRCIEFSDTTRNRYPSARSSELCQMSHAVRYFACVAMSTTFSTITRQVPVVLDEPEHVEHQQPGPVLRLVRQRVLEQPFLDRGQLRPVRL